MQVLDGRLASTEGFSADLQDRLAQAESNMSARVDALKGDLQAEVGGVQQQVALANSRIGELESKAAQQVCDRCGVVWLRAWPAWVEGLH